MVKNILFKKSIAFLLAAVFAVAFSTAMTIAVPSASAEESTP